MKKELSRRPTPAAFVAKCWGAAYLVVFGLVALSFGACDRDSQAPPDTEGGSSAKGTAPGPPPAASSMVPEPLPAAESPTESQPDPPAQPTCPPTMRFVPGGSFWVGTLREVYDREENPRFKTRVAGFCAGIHEVSTEEYEACVEAGKCSPLTGRNQTCNTVEKGRGKHPINCIDYHQAEQVCEAAGGRVPTEIEWEYLARGGAEMRDYPWGSEHPDGRTCWKHAGTCERGSFAPGAFGLHDVVGNVWEWTSSHWGRYPWPEESGSKRVFRGGSWSRRFEKWLRPTLRNRLDESGSGSHLGVRCVSTPPGVECAYGKTPEGECRFGVDEVSCLDGDVWNGLRCAKPGDESRCAPGTHEVEGHGCVREKVVGKVDSQLDTKSVTRSRSPEFDGDCVSNYPGRPHAYRFVGGGHLARNAVGKKLGCKNRDVGVGFNSSCCP